MYARIGLISLAALLLTVCACTERRPLSPRPEPGPLVHEPWEDQEAEDIACLISGAVSAPHDVYQRVVEDLCRIRQAWGDSIPSVLSIEGLAPFVEADVGMHVDSANYQKMQSGLHREFDSLNAQLHGGRLSFSDGKYVRADIPVRANIWRVRESYERLHGVKSVWPTTGRWDGPRLYAHLETNYIGYLFRDAWGDCPSGCYVSHYHYFQAQGDSILFRGSWLADGSGTPEPEWWIVGRRAQILWREGDSHFRLRDTTPPDRVNDLSAGGLQSDSQVTLSFTAPADRGVKDQPAEYVLRWGPAPINDDNWYFFPSYAVFDAQAPGTIVSLTLKNLPVSDINYIAMRSVDVLNHVSAVSNNVTVQAIRADAP